MLSGFRPLNDHQSRGETFWDKERFHLWQDAKAHAKGSMPFWTVSCTFLNLIESFQNPCLIVHLYKGMLYLFSLTDGPEFRTTTEEGKIEPQSMVQKPIGLRNSISPENCQSENVPRENRRPQPETLIWSLILSYSLEDPRSLYYVKLDVLAIIKLTGVIIKYLAHLRKRKI